MFQKFFSDTLMSRFIKNLLSKEQIPLLDFVSDGDILLLDCLYLYKCFVIRCVRSGKLFINESDHLYPSENLYPSAVLYPGTGETPAMFKVVAQFDTTDTLKYAYSYKSTVHWYDSETHKHLGNYLRYLRDFKNLDLMPFYNCYNAQEVEDVYLAFPTMYELHPAEELYPENNIHPGMKIPLAVDAVDSSYRLGHSDMHRVIAVPIKFNKSYTISVECPTTIQLRSVIYNSTGMVKISGTEDKYYSDDLDYSYVVKNCSRFSEPFLYSVQVPNKTLYERQKDLYLLIQLPASNSSSIVVLEGDYTNLNKLKTSTDHILDYSIYRKLSLLQLNTYENYAFSNRLIEYLLTNVITHLDEFSTNIEEVQNTLVKMDNKYRELDELKLVNFGVWNDAIKEAVLRIINKYGKEIYFQDQDGYINRDVEDLLLREKGYRL